MVGTGSGTARLDPCPDQPGWQVLTWPNPDGYNARVLGRTLVRSEGPTVARVRVAPGRHLANAMGNLHGGAMLGLADMSLFAALFALTGRDPSQAVTLDLATQFVGPGRIADPVDSVVELLRETGRLAFLRGTVEQDDGLIGAFTATVRKLGGAR